MVGPIINLISETYNYVRRKNIAPRVMFNYDNY